MEVGETIPDVLWLLTRLTEVPRIVSKAVSCPAIFVPATDFSCVMYELFLATELGVTVCFLIGGAGAKLVEVLRNSSRRRRRRRRLQIALFVKLAVA
jgi:hypothetical protein